MLENTNIKQFYPGPILNKTLDITDFLFKDPEQVHITYTYKDEGGSLSNRELTYGTEYEVIKILPSDVTQVDAALTASTGKVTLKSDLNVALGERLTIYRESEIVQETQYPRTGPFPAASHEGALDYLTMQNQEQQDQIDRALKVPISTANFDGALPIPVPARALKINNSGSGFELSEYDPDTALETTKTYMEDAQVAAANALASQNAAANSETLAMQQANLATSKADIATSKADIATSKANEATEIVENSLANIESKTQEEINKIKQTGFFMQDNKLYYITSEGETKELINVLGYNLFDLKYSDHILEGNEAKGFALLGSYAYKTAVAGSRYGYPDFYNKCVAEKIAGTETTITVGDYSFTGYKNANGHIFFDIADKGTVDNIYTLTGKAWYYGIDTANERIFLPRVKNALVGMADIADTSAVVPNTTNPMPQFTAHNNLNAVGNLHTFSVSGSAFNQVHWNGQQGNNNGNLLWTTKGNTGLLSDNANVKSALNNDNFYIYMCVGNTEQEGAVTDVIDITTSENDTIPLGWSTYQKGVTPSSAFLASLGQQNSGTFYPTFYNEFSAKIGQAFGAGFVKAHTASDITDYDLVINQDEQTFRLPLKNGKENLVDYTKPTTFAIKTNFTVPSNGVIYACANAYSGNKAWYWTINGGEKHYFGENSSGLVPVTVKVKKGDVFYITGNSENENNSYFYPFIGNGTLYYKVSNAVQNLQLLDVAETTTALANKVDSTNTQWAVNACMPDYTAGVNISSYSSSTNQFTVPINGWIIGGKDTGCYLYINDVDMVGRSSASAPQGGTAFTFPVSTGDKFHYSGNVNYVRFFPAKGAQ